MLDSKYKIGIMTETCPGKHFTISSSLCPWLPAESQSQKTDQVPLSMPEKVIGKPYVFEVQSEGIKRSLYMGTDAETPLPPPPRRIQGY